MQKIYRSFPFPDLHPAFAAVAVAAALWELWACEHPIGKAGNASVPSAG